MIDVYVLNKEFQVIGVIDTYESFIWTDRFNSYGDFELYTSFDPKVLQMCQQDYYMHINQSEHTMIIEGIEIETDSETGIKMRITGRSLESILDRRIIWQKTTIGANAKFETAVTKLINESIINPLPTKQRAKRRISNFRIEPSGDDYIDGIRVEKVQYTGDNLYNILQDMFQDVNNTIGYKITLDENNNFVFQLYSGEDRSYQQSNYVKTADTSFKSGKTYYELINGQYVPTSDTKKQKNKTYYEYRDMLPFVVFSPGFDNIINTDYLDSIAEMKNVTLVAGEDSGTDRKTLIVGSETGLERRELYTDARDLRSEDYGDQYTQALRNRGYNKLVENSRIQSYEGQVEATRQFVFGIDFFMGDIIQMTNEYGIEGAARVIEWVMSETGEGSEVYPTFDAVQVIDDTEEEED